MKEYNTFRQERFVGSTQDRVQHVPAGTSCASGRSFALFYKCYRQNVLPERFMAPNNSVLNLPVDC